MADVSLKDLIAVLESLAPPEGAAEWDNAGLILESPHEKPVSRILLTLDLTSEVAAEAVEAEADVIVAYHPPIFTGIRCFVRADPVAAPLLDLLGAGISVYSPHTALDAAPEGMSDWLADGFDSVSRETVGGSGRILSLRTALSADELGHQLQEHLSLPYLRRALSPTGPESIQSLALCPGAGASVLMDLNVDAVVTGEMKHHDLLALTRRGVHVFISEHSHTERPYLPVFRERLLNVLPQEVDILVSQKDKDPVELVAHRA
jgi:dinuclear metal center YbgI/SA1388 family protein